MMKNTHFIVRIKALLIDYLWIVLYLILLFGVMMSIYFGLWKEIPYFNEAESQWMAFLASVLPITLFFTIRESRRPYASLGKEKVQLEVQYNGNLIIGSIIRNVLKFLPWQLGHLAAIGGMYRGYDSLDVMIYYALSLILPILYIGMAMFRKDHRHLPDLLAKSYIVQKEKE